MTKTKVESSLIDGIEYEGAEKRLVIEFKDGARYEYADVPAEVALRLLKAESVGKFFHANIRNQYKATKLDPAAHA